MSKPVTAERIIDVADALLLHPEQSSTHVTPTLCLKALRSLDPKGEYGEVAGAVSLLLRYGLLEETTQSGQLLITERGLRWRGDLKAALAEVAARDDAAYRANLATIAGVELAAVESRRSKRWAWVSGICAIVSALAALAALVF